MRRHQEALGISPRIIAITALCVVVLHGLARHQR
jgi:hypothetical protein